MPISPGSARTSATTPITILCVDSDADTLTITQLALQLDEAIVVHIAHSEEQALQLLSNIDFTPDCLLLEGGGLAREGKRRLAEVRALRNHRATPIIFITTFVRDVDLKAYLELGALGCIAKPFDPLTLAQDVRAFLKGNGVPERSRG